MVMCTEEWPHSQHEINIKVHRRIIFHGLGLGACEGKCMVNEGANKGGKLRKT